MGPEGKLPRPPEESVSPEPGQLSDQFLADQERRVRTILEGRGFKGPELDEKVDYVMYPLKVRPNPMQPRLRTEKNP
jgi:hypothetical protein